MSSRSQDEIKVKLESLELPVDELLLQYVAVLIGNRKSASEIGAELANLLADTASSVGKDSVEKRSQEFARWLFADDDQKVNLNASQHSTSSSSTAAHHQPPGSPEVDIVMDLADPVKSKKPPRTTQLKKPVTFHVTLNSDGTQSNTMETTAVDAEDQKPLIMPDQVAQIEKKRLRCRFWPTCGKGELCEFVHPTELCLNFPRCTYGNECLFIHPATAKSVVLCKFGMNCTNVNCTFQHPSRAMKQRGGRAKVGARSTPYAAPKSGPTMCINGTECSDPQCTHTHPSTVDCHFGEKCTKAACRFKHPLSRPLPDTAMKKTISVPCRYGGACKKPTCPFLHQEGNGGRHLSERNYSAEDPVASIAEFAAGAVPSSSGAEAESAMEIAS